MGYCIRPESWGRNHLMRTQIGVVIQSECSKVHVADFGRGKIPVKPMMNQKGITLAGIWS